MISQANPQQPTWLPDGGAGRLDGTSEPARLTEGVRSVEWKQLKNTNATPFAASRHFPQRGQQGSLCEFALDFLNGILRTAPDPSGASRRLSFALSSCTPFYEWLHLLNLSGEVKIPQKVSTGGVECGNRFCGEVHVETPRNIGCGQVVISSFCPVDKKSA